LACSRFPAATFSVRTSNLLGEVAAVASAFLPPVGALASAALASPVHKRLDLLFCAAADAWLDVGLAHAWEPPVTGYHAVVLRPEPPGDFRVSDGGRLLNRDGAEVRAAYLVLRLDAQQQRHNWAKIPERFDHCKFGGCHGGVTLRAPRRGGLIARTDCTEKPMPAHDGVLAGQRWRAMNAADRVIRWSTALAVV